MNLDNSERCAAENEGEPSTAVESVEEERSASLTMRKCTYADSYRCIDCFKLTRPCTGAARRGCLECLRHLHERTGAEWDAHTSRAAAREGHLECLKYMYENKCPWDAGACSDAARQGHLECLKYLHENGCPWDKWAYRPVAQGGHVECLQYLRENGCPSGESMVDSTTSPRIEKYKVGRIARVTREDNEQVLKDISNVNQPQPQCMKDLCAEYNCEEVQVKADGNCQFRALSLGLYGSEDRHAEVRANIVQHLRENAVSYFQFVEGDKKRVFADYVNRISHDGQWGDEITLAAFVEYYSRGVRVLRDSEKNSVIDHMREGLQEDAIMITYHGKGHYNGAKPICA